MTTEDTNNAEPVGSPVVRPVRPLRVLATILVPLLMLAGGFFMAALTRWLDQYLAGKAGMVLLLAVLLGVIARMVWTWPEWNDDGKA